MIGPGTGIEVPSNERVGKGKIMAMASFLLGVSVRTT
jgi:hypothetical protein